MSVATNGAALEFEKIGDRVYVALQPFEQRFNDCNVIVLVGDDAVLIVDAPANAEHTRDIVEAVRELTDRPVRYVVNTHWHSDHTQGNAVYRERLGEEVIFIGHETLVEDVPARAAGYISNRVGRIEKAIPAAEKQLEDGIKDDGTAMTDEEKQEQAAAIARAKAWLKSNKDVTFLAPDSTYSESLTLHLGGLEVRLKHHRAHTRGDTVIHLPSEGIVITGDMLDALPYVGHGYLREWLTALDAVRALDEDITIPGHGPVFTGTAQLELVRDFIDALVTQTAKALESGSDLAATLEVVDLSTFRTRFANGDAVAERFFDGTLNEAVERAWTELRGETKE
jgi:glyoxylase-like metal-dependent hydrolase (beta-lactamase superfamily II)